MNLNCKFLGRIVFAGLFGGVLSLVSGQTSDAESVLTYISATGTTYVSPAGTKGYTISTDIEQPSGAGATFSIQATVSNGSINNYSQVQPQSATLDVGRVYLVSVAQQTSIANIRLNVNPPAGYEVHFFDPAAPTFDNVTREYKLATTEPGDGGASLDITPTIRMCILPEVTAASGGQAGSMTWLSNNAAAWRIFMGYLPNGLSAGYLEVYDRGRAPGGFTGAFDGDSLIYTAPSPEIRVQKFSGTIFGYEAGVQIQTLTAPATGYTVKFYHNSQVTDTQAVGGTTFSGLPFMVYTIQQGGDPTKVKITRAATGPTTTITQVATVQRTGTSLTNYTYTFTDWHTDGQTPLVSASTVSSIGAGASGHNETTTLSSTAGGNSQVGSRQFVATVYGEVPVATQSGTAQPETKAISYHETDATNIGSYGRPKLVTGNNGSWQAFEYRPITYSATVNQGQFRDIGVVQRSHRPFLNTTAPGPLDDLSARTLGVITTYDYLSDAYTQQNGLALRPSDEVTTTDGTTTAHSHTDYVDLATPLSTIDGVRPVVQATRTDYAGAGDTVGLKTITKYVREYSVSTWDGPGTSTLGQYFGTDTFYRKQVLSVQKPDGTKQSYAYQHGTFGSGAFTASTSPSPFTAPIGQPYGWSWVNRSAAVNPAAASRIAVISGTANASNPDGTSNTLYSGENGFPLDPVYLVDGKSTRTVTIRDLSALVRRTETYVWSGGAFQLVAAEDLAYDAANNLTSKVSSTGATYSAYYDGGRKQSETDASGVTVNYFYDDAGRVHHTIKTGVAGQKDLRTDFTLDAAGHVVAETVSAVGGTGEAITTGKTYDDAGRLSTATKPGQGTTSYTYSPTLNQVSMTLPNGGSRVEVSYPDGRQSQVTGSGVVPQFFSYDRPSDGTMHTLVRSGSAGSPRIQESYVDWLGRTVKTTHPTLVDGVAGTFIENKIYDATTGLLAKCTRTDGPVNRLYADTYYFYDSLSQLTRTGLDIDNSGGITVGGTDRVTDTNQFYENYQGTAYWLTKTTTTYPTLNSGAAQLVNTTRQRLTGLGGAFQGEVMAVDLDGNVTDSQTTVNRAASTVTVSTTATGYSNTQSVVAVNGLTTSRTGFDGLTYGTEYDDLQRPSKSVDPRTGKTTTTYYTGTVLPQTVTDAASNLVATYFYDGAGRVTATQNAGNFVTRTDYNTLDQVVHQWGSAAYPLEYFYDVYGQRTELHTYQTGTSWAAAAWPGGTPTSVTKWAFDESTGLLTSKTDAANKSVLLTYNARGQTHVHTWARGVTTTFAYDGGTGELLSKTYSDGTPTVSFTSTRAGLPYTVSDATGLTNLVYDPAQPQRLASLAFDTFYGNRVETLQYDSIQRPKGFLLGTVASPAADLTQTATYSTLGRFDHIDTLRSGQTALSYAYTYKASSPLVAGYTSGSFATSRDYEASRDLVTKVDALWGGTSRTRYDVHSNALMQRDTLKQSGTAYADYATATYSGTFRVFAYNGRGELQTDVRYRGDTPSTAPAAADELPARRFEYRYDAIGNRKTSGATGSANTADDEYTPNALNQYTFKENNTVKVLGLAATGAAVAVRDAPSTTKKDHAWGADLLPANGNGPVAGTATVYAALPGAGTGGADIIRTDTRPYTVPAAVQAFSYDEDGNLTSDGVWSYQWDAENRLKQMTTTSAAISGGLAARTLTFQYDYLDRRVQKRVTDGAGAELSSRRYLYDGWNLVAEFALNTQLSTLNLVRSYTWGLDLVGSRTATGGVGALLQIADHASGRNYLPTYDTNGNVAALLNASTGDPAAIYEYGPFGEILRATINDATVADNPWQFSTKFTDSETGLVYYGHRYYSATLGRFINRDPVEESGGVNLYGFCLNDPVDKWDVLGNFTTAEKNGHFTVGGSKVTVYGKISPTESVKSSGDVSKTTSSGANGLKATTVDTSGPNKPTGGPFSAAAGRSGGGALGRVDNLLGEIIFNAQTLRDAAPNSGSTISAYRDPGAGWGLEGGKAFLRGFGNTLSALGSAIAHPIDAYRSFTTIREPLTPYGSKLDNFLLDTKMKLQSPYGRGSLMADIAVMRGASLAGPTVSAFRGGLAGEGTQLFRVFGDEARGLGQYYTTTNPGAVANFRETAGLFPGNSGQFLLQGTLNNTEGVIFRSAAPGPGGVGGGLSEVFVPNPGAQINITNVSGVNPPF